MKFQHLSEIYKTTFESLNDGKRIGNRAGGMNQNEILALHPEWERNEWQGYSAYADMRIIQGLSHDEAMAWIEKYISWRGPMLVQTEETASAWARRNGLDWR